jgi:hypothetical protein
VPPWARLNPVILARYNTFAAAFESAEILLAQHPVRPFMQLPPVGAMKRTFAQVNTNAPESAPCSVLTLSSMLMINQRAKSPLQAPVLENNARVGLILCKKKTQGEPSKLRFGNIEYPRRSGSSTSLPHPSTTW